MKIVIETVPHDKQRYDTVGDWWIDPDGTWQIRVSEMKSGDFEFLVGLHEMVELALCLKHGISAEHVDQFDKNWKEHSGIIEPGDDMSAPYFQEHQLASGIERTVAASMAVNWVYYNECVEAL